MGFAYKVAKEGISFEQFAWYCVEHWGDAVGLPSKGHRDTWHLEHAREALQTYEKMTEEEKAAEDEELYQRRLAHHPEEEAKREADLERYLEMLEQVCAWEPPSRTYCALKDLMVRELEISIVECKPKPPPERNLVPPRQMLRETIKRYRESVAYWEKKCKEADEQERKWKAWMDALAKSIPRPANVPRYPID